MEQDGIYYYFDHTQSSHTLVLADQKSVFQDLPEGADVEFEEVMSGPREDLRIFEWTKAQSIRSGGYALRDWNFETPQLSLEANTKTVVQLGVNQNLEIYEYAGKYLKPAEGEGVVKVRMQEEETPGLVVEGKSWHWHFLPAYKFNLKGHFADKGKFVLTSRRDRVQPAARNRYGGCQVRKPFHRDSGRRAVSSGARHARAARERRAVGHRGGSVGGGNLHRQIWPREGAVPLGPRRQEQRKQLLLDSRGQLLGGQAMGGDSYAAHRAGSDCRFHRRRYRPADHHRQRLQRRADAALDASRQQDLQRHPQPQHEGADNDSLNEIRLDDIKGSEMFFLQAQKDMNIQVKHDSQEHIGNDRT